MLFLCLWIKQKNTIGDYVNIGGDCIILKGVTIGDGSVIAAGSIVTKDIPANVIAGGNLCRVIKMLSLMIYFGKNSM